MTDVMLGGGAPKAPSKPQAATGGAYDPMLGSGGGGSSPSGVAQTALNKDLAFVAQSGNAKQIAAANKVASGKSNNTGGWLSRIEGDVENPLTKVLSVLDYPRAVAVAAMGQTSAPLLGKKPSLSAFAHDVATHATTGHVLAQNEGAVTARSEEGRWGNRIAGIVGDVGLDPLNYLGGLGEAGKGLEATSKILALGTKADEAERVAAATKDAGAAQAATEARAAASAANPGGVVSPDTFGRLTTHGVAGLSDEEKAALGVRSGIGVGPVAHRAVLIPGSVTDPLSAALHQFGNATRDKAATGAFARRVMPHAAVRLALKDAAQKGDWEQAGHLSTLMKASAIPMGSRQAFLNEHGPALKAAVGAFHEDEMPDLRNALEGVPSTLDPARVQPVRDALDQMRESAVKAGVDLGNVADYFPHQLSEAARKASTSTNSRQAFTGELKRTLKPGSIFLGHELKHGSVDEINDIAKSEHGKDAYDLFNTDTAGALGSYMHGMASRVGQQDLANHLDKMGLTASGDAAMAHPDWEKAANSGAFEGAVTPQYIKDGLAALRDEHTASALKKPTGFAKHYDRMMNLWKNYQLAMPGKAIRHTVAAPAWSSYIGGVKIGSMRKGMSIWRAYQHGGLDALKGGDRGRVEEFLKSGAGHGHAFEDLHGDKPVTYKNPFSSNFAYFRGNREVQSRAQDYSRFAMFNDARDKGMDKLEAGAKTRSFMGDPHNLTDFERNVMRRIVPFYAFLRTQMPTQLKALARTPGKFENFINAEHDLEEGSPSDNGDEPSFYKQTMSFRLPWKSNGNSQYLSPDLPFTRINQLFSGGNQLLAQTAPEVQIPLEKLMGGVNASTGAPFSKTSQNLPGVMNAVRLGPVLAALGLASKTQADQSDYGQTTSKGTYRMTPEVLQALDSILPPVAQARRIDTSGEPNLQQRAGTTQLSDLVGQNFRTNDPYQQASEIYRRDALIKKMVEAMQANATLPAYLRGFKK